MLRECSSWVLGNDTVKIFFLTPNRNLFAGKFVKCERFLTGFREHVILIFSMSSDDVCSKKYFQKTNYKYEILHYLYFGSNFVFWGTALGRFSQCFFFNFSSSANHGGRNFDSAPHHKKGSLIRHCKF